MKTVLVDIRKLNYTAASGNRCFVKVVAQGGGSAALDITWLRQASPEDIQEFEAWLVGALSDQGISLNIELSVYEQDAATRHEICDTFMKKEKPQ